MEGLFIAYIVINTLAWMVWWRRVKRLEEVIQMVKESIKMTAEGGLELVAHMRKHTQGH